jgi:proteasome assembly chaperone (PAC2) family protein
VSSLRWQHHPNLRKPVLVAGFTGWNDAGDAASDAVAWLSGQFGVDRFATIDPEEHMDFQAVRPTVELTGGLTRDIRWPTVRFDASATRGRASHDLILVSGPEPSMRWREFCEGVLAVAHDSGTVMVVTLGALLADTPHTRIPRVTGSTTDPDLTAKLGLRRSRYEGPTGIVGVLHDACRSADIPSVSLWAPVPHYVSTPPNPPGTFALLERLGTLMALPLDLEELRVAASAWQTRIDSAVDSDDDLRDYVRTLESQLDSLEDETEEPEPHPEDLPSGDAIAEAFEQYLREQGLE